MNSIAAEHIERRLNFSIQTTKYTNISQQKKMISFLLITRLCSSTKKTDAKKNTPKKQKLCRQRLSTVVHKFCIQLSKSQKPTSACVRQSALFFKSLIILFKICRDRRTPKSRRKALYSLRRKRNAKLDGFKNNVK